MILRPSISYISASLILGYVLPSTPPQHQCDTWASQLTPTQVRSFATLLSQAFTLLRPGGLLLLFDYDLLPILADESTPLSAQAWHDAFSKSMKKAGMPLFGLAEVIPCFGGREVEGKDMRVPIGHGDGASLSSLLSCRFLGSIPLT